MRTARGRSAVIVSCIALAACSGPRPRPEAGLFDDAAFARPSERISADEVFALSDAMRSYLVTVITPAAHNKGKQEALLDALYDTGQLKLEYDSDRTRNAAQAFAARSGNCLSLVIMTAAFAKALDLPVRYQSVLTEETWSRVGGIIFSSGHVNLVLGKKHHDVRAGLAENDSVTVDFVRLPDNLPSRLSLDIQERTLVGMYMNNRAGESLARGLVDDAYWFAREAIAQAPGFLSAYNTLAVVYRRHGDLKLAERALGHVLEREAENRQAMSNLALVLGDEGRASESLELSLRLTRLQPYPPFFFFKQGQAAMRAGDFHSAKVLFAREVSRADYSHEFHFWLAAACLQLGEKEEAARQLAFAVENSTVGKERNIYAAKLARLNAERARRPRDDELERLRDQAVPSQRSMR